MRLPLLPLNNYIFFGAYFVVTSLLKWRFKPDLSLFFYLGGALFGMHLLDLFEQFVFAPQIANEQKFISPLRSMVVQLLLIPVTFFILTSTKSLVGAGCVLFLNLRFLDLQYLAKQDGKLSSWVGKFTQSGVNLTHYLRLISAVFIFQTVIFILI